MNPVRRTLAFGLVMLALAACGASERPYFPKSRSVIVSGTPALTGEAGLIGIDRIEAKPGDRVVLDDLVPVDLQGSGTVEPWVILMSETGGGGVGALAESIPIIDGHANADLLHPLRGFVLTDEIGTVQVVLGVTLDEAGSASWMKTAISYEVDGKAGRQEWTYGGIVCAGDPLPDCDLPQ